MYMGKNSERFFLVEIQGSVQTVPFLDNETVLEATQAAGIDISTSCGGMGTCGACRIELIPAETELPARNEIELEMAIEREFEPNERLACQLSPCMGMKIKVPG